MAETILDMPVTNGTMSEWEQGEILKYMNIAESTDEALVCMDPP